MARGHGKELRGIANVKRSSIDNARFGRMFRWLRPAFPNASASDSELLKQMCKALADAMNQKDFPKRKKEGKPLDSAITEDEPEDENPTITAGYTYLGQFIDHDITFDPASSLDKLNDPDALVDFRTPRLDLDSVYGRGPDDQPYLYVSNGRKDSVALQTGVEQKPPSLLVSRPDHQRNGQDIALIGDPRNDENLLVGQIHNLFVRFHNKVVNTAALVPAVLSEKARFAEAQRLVRWHYQWIVINDFLRKIVGDKMVDAVLDDVSTAADGRGEPRFKFYKISGSYAYMPVEFSVAAYRFGHSMVRPSYSLSRDITGGSDPDFKRVPVFSMVPGPLANLNGFRSLPPIWGLDFGFFFPDLSPEVPAGFKVPQPSYRIDTQLVDPLANLPQFAAPDIVSLAERNLLRGISMDLPSGQSVAEAMGLIPMTDDELWSKRPELQAVFDKFPVLKGRAPLWYYVLREAESTVRDGFVDLNGGGHHLGPVGGRIVAEVLIGLIWNDHTSYLYQSPRWKPPIETALTAGVFNMADLVRFVDGPNVYVKPQPPATDPPKGPYGTPAV